MHWPPTYSPDGPVAGPDLHPAIQAIYESVFGILDWLTHTSAPELPPGRLDPQTRRFHPLVPTQPDTAGTYHSCWQPLGLGSTPVVILSSLAPGIDTLVVEAAFAYKKWHPEADITVRAPLPFPEDVYRESSTFSPCAPHQNPCNLSDAPRRRFQHLVGMIQAQPGYCQERDLFCVPLHDSVRTDPLLNPTGDPAVDLDAKTESPEKFTRRYIRFRAAGEYIAAYSDILLAAYDEEHDRATEEDLVSFQSPGSAVIALAKRRGLSDGLLPIPNIIAWADTGPVLHLPLDREKKLAPATVATALPCTRPLQFLQPFDALPEDIPISSNPPNHHPRWQESGHRLLLALARNLTAYHKLLSAPDTPPQPSRDSLRQLFSGSSRATQANARFEPAIAATLACPTFPFGAYAQLRDLTASISKQWGGWATTLHRIIGALAILSLLCFVISTTAFTNFPSLAPHEALLRLAAFVIATGCFIVACLLHKGIGSTGWLEFILNRKVPTPREIEDRQFDYRAIAEGMRVQSYWSAAGLFSAVASRYIQRLRGELGWVRCVISSVTFPYLRTREWFLQRPLPEQLLLLEAVQKGWVEGQIRYFDNAVKNQRRQLESFGALSLALFVAAFLMALVSLYSSLAASHQVPPSDLPQTLLHSSPPCLGGALLFLGVPFLCWLIERSLRTPAMKADEARSSTRHHPWRIFFPSLWLDDPRLLQALATGSARPRLIMQPLGRLLATEARREHLAQALHLISAIGFGLGLTLLLSALPMQCAGLPAAVCTPELSGFWKSFLLGASGLAVGWIQHHTHAENVRRYAATQSLFRGANTRLTQKLNALRASLATPTPAPAPAPAPAQPLPAGAVTPESLVHDIQELLLSLGQEALTENAEWVVMRRTRRIQPIPPAP